MQHLAVASPGGAGALEQLDAALDAVGANDHAGAIDATATSALADLLYARWYARPCWAVDSSPHCPPDLVELLRASHACSFQWEEGWRADRVGSRGQVVAVRDGAVRMLERSDYVAVDRPGLLPRPGDELSATGRCDGVEPADGWWRTRGPGWSWRTPPDGLVRLYWNTRVHGLPDLVHLLTTLLADEADPWLLKCARDVEVYARADAAVLYLTRDTVDRLAGALVDAALALGADARPGGPPLTLQVRAGLAVALCPGGAESFGSNRCRLVAEGITAHRTEAPDGQTVLDAVVARLLEDGVEVARPWARRDDASLPWER